MSEGEPKETCHLGRLHILRLLRTFSFYRDPLRCLPSLKETGRPEMRQSQVRGITSEAVGLPFSVFIKDGRPCRLSWFRVLICLCVYKSGIRSRKGRTKPWEKGESPTWKTGVRGVDDSLLKRLLPGPSQFSDLTWPMVFTEDVVSGTLTM